MNDKCPKCNSENVYPDGANALLWVCPDCTYEWVKGSTSKKEAEAEGSIDTSVRDANGNVLSDGDAVIVLKDLKVKGSSSAVKGGTKVRNIRLSDAGDGHNIACKIDGIGSIHLKSEFVRKA